MWILILIVKYGLVAEEGVTLSVVARSMEISTL